MFEKEDLKLEMVLNNGFCDMTQDEILLVDGGSVGRAVVATGGAVLIAAGGVAVIVGAGIAIGSGGLATLPAVEFGCAGVGAIIAGKAMINAATRR